MKKVFTLIRNGMDRLGENNTFLKCAFCFMVICMATLIGGLLGKPFGDAVVRVLATVAAIVSFLGCVAMYPNLWDIAGPQLDKRSPVPQSAPVPVRLVKTLP